MGFIGSRVNMLRSGAAAFAAVAAFAASQSEALAAPFWTHPWRGDAGFSVKVPAGTCGFGSDAIVRLYGDTRTPYSTSANLILGTTITLNAPTVNPPSSVVRLQLPGRSTGFSAAEASALNAAPVLPGGSNASGTANARDSFWPGAPFLTTGRIANPSGTSTGACNLVSYGSLVRGGSRVWGLRLDLDVSTLSGSSPVYTLRWTSRLNGFWDFGSSFDPASGAPTNVFRTYCKAPPVNGRCLQPYVSAGTPNPTDGTIAGASPGIDLPPGGVGIDALNSSTDSVSTYGQRGSIVSDAGGKWWFVSTAANYGSLVYALPLDSPTGPVTSGSARGKLLFSLSSSAVKTGSVYDLVLPDSTCKVYDPMIHPDQAVAGNSPLTFSVNSPKATGKCSGGVSQASVNKWYGSYQIDGFWPTAMTSAAKALQNNPPPLANLRARHRSGLVAPGSSDHLLIDMWPGRLRNQIAAQIAAQAAMSVPQLSRRRAPGSEVLLRQLQASLPVASAAADPQATDGSLAGQPNWDISCTFLVPNSEAEYAVQQVAQARAEAAVLAAQESDNATRILVRAQQARDAAAAAYDRRPSSGNRKALALASSELVATQVRYGKVAALLTQRQEASIQAQRAACGEGRSSWVS